jgi:hypothetical protein
MEETDQKSKKRERVEKVDFKVPVLPLELNPSFGILDKIAIKIKLIVKDIECTANISYVPNDLILDSSKLPEYLFNTSLNARDLTSYCHKLHENLQTTLNAKALNINFDGKTDGNVVVSTSKKMKAKVTKRKKSQKDEDDGDEY